MVCSRVLIFKGALIFTSGIPSILANESRLNSLWTRIDWLVYFAFLILFTSSTYFASSILARLLASRASFSPLPSPTMELNTAARAKPSHPIIGFFKRCWASWRRVDDFVLRQVEVILRRAEDPRVTWLQGIGWAVCGGSLAGMCLVFTKAVVSLLGRKDHPVSFVLFCSAEFMCADPISSIMFRLSLRYFASLVLLYFRLSA